MTFDEFDKFQTDLFAKCGLMTVTKGKEYANSEDRFANFNRLAESLGLTNIQVGWVYTAKHLDAIAQYCRTGETHSNEGIEGRIVDAITYLTLIAGMIHESAQRVSPRNRHYFTGKFNSPCDICHLGPLDNIHIADRT